MSTPALITITRGGLVTAKLIFANEEGKMPEDLINRIKTGKDDSMTALLKLARETSKEDGPAIHIQTPSGLETSKGSDMPETWQSETTFQEPKTHPWGSCKTEVIELGSGITALPQYEAYIKKLGQTAKRKETASKKAESLEAKLALQKEAKTLRTQQGLARRLLFDVEDILLDNSPAKPGRINNLLTHNGLKAV